MVHFAGPAQEAPEFAAFAPHKFPKLQKADLGHLNAGVRLDAPKKIRAAPGGEMVAFCCIPEEAEFVEHANHHYHKGH